MEVKLTILVSLLCQKDLKDTPWKEEAMDEIIGP